MSSEEQRLAAEIRQEQPFKSKGHAVLISLMLTADRVMREFDRSIGAEADLTQQQYNVLRILRGAGPEGLPTLEVAERMIQQSPGMTRMMDRLAKKGLIDRERSTVDRRQVRCILTSKGQELLSKLDPCVEAFDAKLSESLTSDDQSTTLRCLERMRESI